MVDMTLVIISTLLGAALGSIGTFLFVQPTIENLRRANARLIRRLKND